MLHGFIDVIICAPSMIATPSMIAAEAIGGVNYGASLGGAKFGAKKKTVKKVRGSRYE